MIHLRYKLLALLILVSAGSFGQYPDSLLNYLEVAAKNSPVLRQKYYEYQAAIEKVPQVGALQDPELSIGVFLTPMELVEGRQVTDITLMQMFPWFGVLRNAKDEMGLMANARFEEFRDAKLRLFYDVQSTYYDLYKLRKDIATSGKNIEILRSIENIALVRYKTGPTGSSGSVQQQMRAPTPVSQGQAGGGSQGMQGMGGNTGTGVSPAPQSSQSMQGSGSMVGPGTGTSLSDLYRIKIEIADLENSIALLKDQEQSVVAVFNSMLNRQPLHEVFSADTLVTDSLDLSHAEIIDSIKAENPMLGMVEYERQSYESRKKMFKSMGYPMVGLGLNYSLLSKSEMSEAADMNGKDMLMPMVKITLPIYRKKYKAMQREADLMIRATEEQYSAVSNELQAEFYKAVQLYNDASRRVVLYRDQYQLASKSLELMLSSFTSSNASLTDVLRVRQQLLDYELSRNDAAADVNTAVARIKRLGGSELK